MNSSFTLPPSSFRLGLLGYPLSHSISPQLHTAALKACNLRGDYSLFPIHPEDKQGLQDLLNRVRKSELHGLNVTIPHKQTVVEFLDELTPTAQAIGAVNTIYLREDKLIGDNTDAAGFISDLKKLLAESPSPSGRGAGVRERSALILGAGGSARAVVYALLNDGWNVTISARRLEQAQQLTSQFTNSTSVALNFQTFQLSNFQLIVNTTPLGMTPNIDQSPLPENLLLPSNIFVYDLVYNPRETKLVRDARAQGLHAATGLGMLIEQAALSFEIWTRCNPSREIMRASIEHPPIPSLPSPIL
ncbi:MAG: shikimate dehydrogenase [Anaerolineae bacterium]|nr:MAG: shikimate dehydrogenase [Anaerolineae bacterium]WKZ43693.1 MAG: shikimate dehydrogenase [Anaerolineales bacterium]